MANLLKEKLRAREKLTEARFFLEELKRNRNNWNNFQRYLSAFIAAWRSVTWVLQKDIKTTLTDAARENSDELMKWYREEAQILRALPHAKALLELRNVLEKEGGRLPVYQFVVIGLTDEFKRLELSYDASTSQFVKVGWEIDPTAALPRGAIMRLPKPMRAEEAKNWMEENQEKVQKETLNIVLRQMERAAAAIKKLANGKIKAAGYIQLIIDNAGTTMPFDDFINLLEDHINSLEQLIAKAENHILAPQRTSPAS